MKLVRAESLPQPADWGLAGLSGRLCELAGAAATTLACRLIVEAQRSGEPAAWITAGASFFPPDAAASGVDLDALVVVRAGDENQVARAADPLARSGAFGLLILDGAARVPQPLLSRLLGLAQKHAVAILFLTETPLGSLVSLRAEVRVHRRDGKFDRRGERSEPSPLDRGCAEGDARFECVLTVGKDKRRAPGWTHREECRGPAGLR